MLAPADAWLLNLDLTIVPQKIKDVAQSRHLGEALIFGFDTVLLPHLMYRTLALDKVDALECRRLKMRFLS
jgi:hypothetical protein